MHRLRELGREGAMPSRLHVVELSRANSGPGQCDKLVLAILVPPERAAHLAAALGERVRLHRLVRWSDLRSASEIPPDVVVVDPITCGGPAVALNQALRSLARSAPLVVYTSVTSMAMRRMMDLPALVGAKLVLAGVDDTPDALRITFSAVRSTARQRQALVELETRSGPLPEDVAAALAELLAAGERSLTVYRLARAARMSARTLERRLADADAPPPLWLIKTARAMLARELLSTSPLTVQEVARRVGYARVSSLRALLRWSFDSPPSELRRGPPREPGPRWATRGA
jgi:AraC-like DNA-binding protein